MIKLPSNKELKTLQDYSRPFCLSIYIPYTEPDKRHDPNRIELKNALRQAESALLIAGATPKVVKKTLRPALKLLTEFKDWPMRRSGLAIFVQQDLFHYYQLPETYHCRLLSVMPHFSLEPLVNILDKNEPYYVLALGHKHVKLYSGDRYAMHQLELSSLPQDMHQALNIDEFPKSRETHEIAPALTGKGSEAYHNQYNVAEVDKKMLLTFFRLIDKRLHKLLMKNRRPLVIAGTNYLLPIYRKVNTYDNLIPGGIIGDVKLGDVNSLRDKAVAMVEKYTYR